MKFGYGLLILATCQPVASADTNDTGRYTLPPSKVYIEPCQREALRLHPGEIEKQRMLHRYGDFLAQIEIKSLDGSEWLVLCGLADGKIIREQKLLDDAF
jgi:hypothetical protein